VNRGLQIELPFRRGPEEATDELWLQAGGRRVRLQLVRHRRARRYILRLAPDGTARVTLPRGGSVEEAERFARRNEAWIEKQLLRQAVRLKSSRVWRAGTEILFRGEPTRLELTGSGQDARLRFGDQVVELAAENVSGDARPAVEWHLRRLAAEELPARVLELAARYAFPVRRVVVRNQRSRWGSCSRRGTVSLNWRLVQTPTAVRDYLIFHELAHLREMNHSSRFWREVERLCPNFAEAEQWLKGHADLLR
jgi:predicted metal-dependent hydrolase